MHRKKQEPFRATLKGVLLAFCRSVSAKELLMVFPKEDSTSFLAALLMSGTCNYSFLLSLVNSLIY